MTRKGISPLIAAVMLLALAMAVGGLFSEWSGQLVDSSTQDTSDSQSEVIDCSARTIEISDVSLGSGWVNATLQSDGGDLGEIQVVVLPSQNTDTVDLPKDGIINSTSIQVSGRQDTLRASSTECGASIERELEY
ncbi:MAG: flagellin-like protein [Candidatus Nanohaloarchaea archaeon]|jgi:flagellin-like protein